MKLLVVGGGGREHAIIRSLKKNPTVTEIFACPGNGGIAADALCTGIAATDIDKIVAFALENAESFKILISALDVSEGQNRFTAEAEIFADGKPAGQTKLFGRWFELIDVFVLTRDVSRGEIIQAEDLVQTTIRKNRLRDDIVLAKEDLEGKQALRDIKADKPISSKDIREEVVVKKGATVGVIYKHKGLQITARAEALEDGAKGQRIKLLNTKSQKELTGRVLDKNTVEIAAE